jgi:hypothetical protein
LHSNTERLHGSVARKELFTANFHNQHEGYAAILKEIDELWTEIKKNRHRADLKAQNKSSKTSCSNVVALYGRINVKKIEEYKCN